MHKVFLGVGGNLGNRRLNFQKVHSLIEKELGPIVRKSSIYETSPWGFRTDKHFWNEVLLVETDLLPENLLERIRQIERSFGRRRKAGQYSSRTMDIDILYFDDVSMDIPRLTIPHKLIQERLFVLVPLDEIAPRFRHPLLDRTNRQLRRNCKDPSTIKKVEG